ncbi:ABC transporter family substrate-binding protein [Streptomyces arenae]|uniref:ABC transporter family substrate-binding protein n=1 Tax=Streptomyces arenae TaxID=29301 RepID=UPI002657F648|nr:ABC transporter family substrate-binding protein [Streptomyces arenae]MCG7204668.1 ABC transporter family substrate-binding protein [Streptomyces arenae]
MSHQGVSRSAPSGARGTARATTTQPQPNNGSARRLQRSLAFLTAGALAVPLLAGCGSDDEGSKPLAAQDIAAVARDSVAEGGTLKMAVDAVPETLNTFQADADAGTTRVAQAVLPSMFTIDATGKPVRNPDYLESAKVIETEPRQVVLYKLNQQAVWSDGREIGAADFAAQWRALSGKDSAYWTARNAGYDRIAQIERGANDLEVRVTFDRPYADWRSLFSPLYPKDVMGTPDTFNDGARRKLAVTAGPFRVDRVDTAKKDVVLTRNPRWWGRPAKLDEIDLHAVSREKRASALAAGTVDVADIDASEAERIIIAGRGKGTGTPLQGAGKTSARKLRSWALALGMDEEKLPKGPKKLRKTIAKWLEQQQELRAFDVRKSLEPAYTQLALNGSEGPLADERVRRAVARALDRQSLAKLVLGPLGLPAVPVGSHLGLSGQAVYTDSSGALGGLDTHEAQALLADAGWVAGGPVKQAGGKAAGAANEKAGKGDDQDKGDKGDAGDQRDPGDKSDGGRDGQYVVGEDDKGPDGKDTRDHQKDHAHGAPGAYAPKGTAAPKGAGAPAGPLAKDGQALSLRFVLPSGPGSETLQAVADQITKMLDKVGILTEVKKVPDESYFKDHIAAGQYDLALYSWPASAFPATDARPIYAKPVVAADGSLNVEQNYTRIGTDQVDQLFDQALGTLDEDEADGLLRKADSRIWASAGSLPLYQRPQIVGARKGLVNVGAFGFQTPVYQDMGFLKKGAKVSASPSPKG